MKFEGYQPNGVFYKFSPKNVNLLFFRIFEVYNGVSKILYMNIALHGRKFSSDCLPFVEQLMEALAACKTTLFVYEPFLRFLRSELQMTLPEVRSFSNDNTLPKDTACFFNIGGDGTFLESMALIRDSGIPTVGINLGKLGFLANVSYSDIKDSVRAIVERNYMLEERALLQVESDILPKHIYPYALNEIGIQRHHPAMIGVRVKVNSEELPTYWSDGLLVATPTGSTAYAMSVGGPIVMPNANNFIIAPISPHNLNVRPLVIPDNSVLELSVSARKGKAFFTIDNQEIEIPSGSRVIAQKAPFALRFIRLHGNSFFATLHEKLAWGTDKRN